MFTLSQVPKIQEQQLKDLVEVSERKLKELTSPIELTPVYERKAYLWDELINDYKPPANRFAKFGNTRYSSLNFDH